MAQPIMRVIQKLVIAGEQAGFTVDQMIDLLSGGLSVETLLDLIESRLSPPHERQGSSRWIM